MITASIPARSLSVLMVATSGAASRAAAVSVSGGSVPSAATVTATSSSATGDALNNAEDDTEDMGGTTCRDVTRNATPLLPKART